MLLEMEPKILECDPVYCLATIDDAVCVVIWRGMPTIERVTRCGRVCLSLAGDLGFLAIVEDGSPIPDAATRKRSSEQLLAVRDRVKVQATVIEGDGMFVSLSRATIRGVFALARNPAFIAAKLGDVSGRVARAMRMNEAELVQAIESVRRHYDAKEGRRTA